MDARRTLTTDLLERQRRRALRRLLRRTFRPAVYASILGGWGLLFVALIVATGGQSVAIEPRYLLPVAAAAALQGILLQAVVSSAAARRLLARPEWSPGEDAGHLRTMVILSLLAAVILVAVAYWTA